jgi:hypothetical protein
MPALALLLVLAVDKKPVDPLLVVLVFLFLGAGFACYRLVVFLSDRYVRAHGQVVVAALVQANSNLFSWGLMNWPAQVLFSFENIPQHHLGQLARYVASLKGRGGLTPVEQQVAQTVNDERYVAGLRVKLPVEFTGGPAVYSAHVIIRRRYLPRGYIDGSFFLCMALPGRLSFWQEFFSRKLLMVPFDYQPVRPVPASSAEELPEVLPAGSEPFPPLAEPLDELPDLGPAPVPPPSAARPAPAPLPAPPAPPVQQPSSAATAATLPAVTIAFSCACGKQLHAPASCAGRQSKCPGCGRQVTVPSQVPAAPVPAAAPAPPTTASATLALPLAFSPRKLTPSQILAMVSVGLGLSAILSLSLGSFLLLFILGVAGLLVGWFGYRTSRPGDAVLTSERLALAGMGLNSGAAAIGLVVLVVMGIGAMFRGQPVTQAVSPNPPTTAGDAISSDWQVIFCSADPKIWDQDVNRGANDFARPLVRVAADIRYLRIRKDSDYVLLPMTRERLEQISDDGRYGWSPKQEDSGAYHLGIYDLTRECQIEDICVRSIPWCAGWGFGHIHFKANVQGYCWDGKPIQPCVFEIAVKKEGLTAAESQRLLRK